MDGTDRREQNNGGRGDHDGGGSHYLVVAYGVQGHLNPARALARRLARAHHGTARVTLSVTVAAHASMFPSSPLAASPGEEASSEPVSDGLISYVPYSDGFGFGFGFGARPRNVASLSAVVRRLAAAGRPVMCVVSALSLPVADVAVEHGIPLAVYSIQAATALAVYYHYFHGGYEQVVASHVADPSYKVSFPGLRPLRIRDLPSFLSTGSEHSKASLEWVRAPFEHIAREKPRVLVSSLGVLEAAAIQEMQ